VSTPASIIFAMVGKMKSSWEVFYAAVPLDHGKELRDRLPYILLQQWGV
jgi:hypothetical protein